MECKPVEVFGRLRHAKYVLYQRSPVAVTQVCQREKPKRCEAGPLQRLCQWPVQAEAVVLVATER